MIHSPAVNTKELKVSDSVELIENLSLDEVASIMKDDDIWPFVSEDGISKKDYYPVDHPAFRYLGIYVKGDLAGLFFVHPDNGFTSVRAHIAILKPFRALYALSAVGKLVEWFTTISDRVQKMNAMIPEYNNGAIRLAIESGFKKEGVNRESIMKDGKLYDQIQFGITRKEAL